MYYLHIHVNPNMPPVFSSSAQPIMENPGDKYKREFSKNQMVATNRNTFDLP